MRSFSCITTPLLLASALMSVQVSSTNADVQEYEYKTKIIQRKKRARSLQETRSPSTKAPGPSTKAPGPSTKAPGASVECAPEKANDQFFLKRSNGNYGPPVFQTCEWLSKLAEQHVRHICSRRKSCDDKGPARDVCPETCDSCPNAMKMPRLRSSSRKEDLVILLYIKVVRGWIVNIRGISKLSVEVIFPSMVLDLQRMHAPPPVKRALIQEHPVQLPQHLSLHFAPKMKTRNSS